MMSNAPLISPDCDLRDFAFMPLDVSRLRDSDFAALSDGEEFRAGLLLWCASWHQVPASSLPDDDTVLARLAGYGRVVKEWQKVREGALRGWIKCSDGRLYHPVIAEKAAEAWKSKLKQRWATECARIKKYCQRKKQPYNLPSFEEWLSQNRPEGQQSNVPRDILDNKGGQAVDVPPKSLGKHDPRDRDIDKPTTTDTNVSSVVGDARARGQPGIPVPDDFQPARVDAAKAPSLGLNLDTEVERFVAHYQARSETRADLKAWEAQFRKWMLDQQQYNADRDKVTESRMQTKQSSRAADCAALGVGSQYREVPYLEAANEFR
ncbi:DUF1376 domain-containing protein [Chromobacterium haemolyticum]|uniref:DUF1376 domain-containing protein n=1 Tax=Chromobacterium haemolyticum TaxID=394935 RepID=UPI0018DE3E61|nr:DUF1376 domain-containing protein [Chromobacterium haemolyticum]